MNVRFRSQLPWALAFSFARAIQQPALEIWQGKEEDVSVALKALYHRALCNRATRRVQCRDGKDMSMKSNILQITTSSEKVPAAE